LLEGLLEQRLLVELAEYVSNGVLGCGATDTKRFNLSKDPRAAPVFQPHLRSRAGQGGSMVVERPLAAKPHDRRVDVVVVELPPGKTGAHLRFRELTLSQPFESHDVGTVGAIGHAQGLYAARGGRLLGAESRDDRRPGGCSHLLA